MADSSEQPPALSILSTRGAVEEQTKKKKSEKSVKNHWIKRRLSSLHDLLSENVPPPACTSPTQTQKRNRVYKIVLTGGPCGGKTTGQVRLATFFENAGWKVFTVPETATILLGGGVKFAELSAKQAYEFQKDLLLTLLRIEDVFFNQARLVTDRNVLVICDRGAMDPSAYIDVQGWKQMLHDCGLDQFSLRDGRYDQVVHMVTAADGAEKFYTLSNNDTRKEGLDDAKRQDSLTRSVWVGHPYVDVIDNSECTKFDDKILKLVQVVCDRAGLEYNDRLAKNSKKRKWLVSAMDMTHFPKYEEFSVKHDYLLSDSKDYQARIRSRMQNGKITHTLTTRQLVKGEVVETRMALTKREYEGYLNLKDKSRARLHKKRRCFNYGIQFFHLDIYVSPMPPSGGHKQLMLLETYTTHPKGGALPELPPFLTVEEEVTGNPTYSMYQLSKIPGTSCNMDVPL